MSGPTAQSASVIDSPFSLAIGAAGAYFQPGIRVGSPGLPGRPGNAIPPAPLNMAKTPAESDPAPTATAASATAQASVADTPAPADTPKLSTVERAVASLKAADDVVGDLHAETSAPEKRVPRRKPFLKRTVVPISSHFWPRSWRRAWKRRAAERARHEASQTDATAPAAAE